MTEQEANALTERIKPELPEGVTAWAGYRLFSTAWHVIIRCQGKKAPAFPDYPFLSAMESQPPQVGVAVTPRIVGQPMTEEQGRAHAILMRIENAYRGRWSEVDRDDYFAVARLWSEYRRGEYQGVLTQGAALAELGEKR